MKKSLLALAAIAAVSGSAFAQSSVTIYGRVDQSFAQYAEELENKEIRQGSASRLGFRGVEDLGGGLKAFFQFEHRFTPDDGQANATFWDGKSFVGLRTTFGDVYLGREDSAAYALSQSASDPWGTDTVSQNTTILNGRGIATTRYANSVNYRGTFGGFTVGAQVSEASAAAGGGVKPQQVGDDQPWNVAAVYAGGPFSIAFGYEKPAAQDSFWATLNGSWNFGFMKLMGMYGWGETGGISSTVASPLYTATGAANPTSAARNDERRGFILGLTAPIGNGELKASYAQLENENSVTGAKVDLDKQWGIGYHYALSKRTTIYADVVREDGDLVKLNGNLERTGYDIGIKHNF